MRKLDDINIGIYEKALPKNISWEERIKLVKECGYDFMEISIDETDERLARLEYSKEEIIKQLRDYYSKNSDMDSRSFDRDKKTC